MLHNVTQSMKKKKQFEVQYLAKKLTEQLKYKK